MKRVVLLRHAKAVKEHKHGDAERPLAEAGAADAAEMGGLLARRGPLPDAVLASPARRTLETARIVARELDFPWDRIATERTAYLAEAETLLGLLQELDGQVETALLVGHNPGISELAATLVRSFPESMPTCGAAAVALAVDTWSRVRPGCGSLLWYEVPSRRR